MHADVLDTVALTRERQLAAWMPDLALTMGVLTVAYVLFFFDGWHQLFRDSDTGWHVRTGEAILLNYALPRTDPYSFTREGAPWLDWEWASDVAAGGAHLVSGMAGVALLFAMGIALCSWLWIRLTWQAGGDFLVACALATPMLSTVNMHWLARPHVFGWILLLVWMIWMERGQGAWGGAVALGAVWANVHASFFLAPVIALMYAGGCALNGAIWRTSDGAVAACADQGVHPRWYVKAALWVSLGTLLNPYGIKLHAHVAGYLADTDLLARVGEFQSFNFHVAGAGWILASVGIAGMGAVLALGNRRIEHFLISAFFIGVALRSARALPVVALCVLPIANANIVAGLRRATGLADWPGRRLTAALDYSGRLRDLDRGLAGWAVAPIVALAFLFIAKSADAGFPPDQFPVAAATAVSRIPLDARLLAPDKFGGYLIYRFDGQRKVFFDGRSDFYGARFMREYLRLLEVRPAWRETVTRYRFTHALLPNDYSLVPALEADGWKLVHKDTTATLLARPTT